MGGRSGAGSLAVGIPVSRLGRAGRWDPRGPRRVPRCIRPGTDRHPDAAGCASCGFPVSSRWTQDVV